MASADDIIDDLRAESDSLDALVATLPDEDWERATPAPGWTIAHQIAHLLWTDRVALTSITDEPGFGEVLATAAQLIGAGQAMLDLSVQYAKQRSQFGRVIGSYQAIKHKLADVHIALELARPLVYGAALSLGADSPDTARDVSAAKVAAGEAGLLAARSALQTHGAIGFTQEHDLGLLLLRVQALRSAWGDTTAHRRRVLEAI